MRELRSDMASTPAKGSPLPPGARGVGDLPTLPRPQDPVLAASTVARAFAGGSAATAADAIFFEEVARTRIFLRIAIALCWGAIAGLAYLGGDPTAKWVAMGAALVASGALLWLHHSIRDPTRYTQQRVLPVLVVTVTALMVVIYYFGPLSASPMVVTFGLSIFSLSRDVRATAVIYLICSVGHALMVGLMLAGILADRGLIGPRDLDASKVIVIEVLLQLVIACVYVQARYSRRTTVDAIERLEEAVKAVAQREAVLNEARQELDRAAWIGGPGRFTDQTLGSFKLGAIIGRGGMGEVYEAHRSDTGQIAAVKLLHRNVLADPDGLARFVREARAAQAIDSPHVVKVFEIADANAPTPFLAMERLHGHDLAYHLRTNGRFSVDRTLELTDQVAAGLEAARAAGIVHRDLKPQNVHSHELPGSSPIWKILDFGLSKLDDHHGTLTKGRLLGTPAFMAPEQVRGAEVDHRADVHALAVIVYRALTGHPAFTGADLLDILTDVMTRMPRRPSELVAVPPDTDAVLAVALAKRPSERFQTAAELAVALRDAAGGHLDEGCRNRATELLSRLPWGGRLEQ